MKGGFSFGAPAPAGDSKPASSGFSFGNVSAAPTPAAPGGFNFGAPKADDASKPADLSKPAGFAFGGAAPTPAAGGFSFGDAKAPAPATGGES